MPGVVTRVSSQQNCRTRAPAERTAETSVAGVNARRTTAGALPAARVGRDDRVLAAVAGRLRPLLHALRQALDYEARDVFAALDLPRLARAVGEATAAMWKGLRATPGAAAPGTRE